MENAARSAPLPALPYDSLRHGLTTLEEHFAEKHPVQALQEEDTEAETYRRLRDIYGTALPARMQIERQILERPGRLPPLPCSNLGSDVYFGRLSTFDSRAYLGLEEFSEQPAVDTHSQMEALLGLGTKPATRGFL